MDLLTSLLLGNFAFTAGAYIWGWKIYERLSQQINNHMKTEISGLKAQLHKYDLCSDDCLLCAEEVK